MPAADVHVGLALPERPSVAVQRFDDLGALGHEQHFVDGLTEDLTMHLSRYRELFVIASATITSYAARVPDRVELARDLGVGYVVRGSVHRTGDDVRVRAELIGIADGATVWAEHFDSGIADLFRVQDEISRAVAGRLVPELVEAGVARLVGRPTDSLGACYLYLRALSRQADFCAGAQLETIELARMAIALDDGFAAAHMASWLALWAPSSSSAGRRRRRKRWRGRAMPHAEQSRWTTAMRWPTQRSAPSSASRARRSPQSPIWKGLRP